MSPLSLMTHSGRAVLKIHDDQPDPERSDNNFLHLNDLTMLKVC